MTGRTLIGRAAALGLAVLAVTGLAGCSGDDGDGAGGGKAGATPADAVTTSFRDYASAVNAKNGDLSADLMSASSRTYYNRLRKLALDADQATLQKQPMVDQITVLTFRDRLPAVVLRKASVHDLVSRAVQLGLISQNNAAGISLGQISISGTTATAQLKQQGETAPVTYPVKFQLEDNRWRFDITSLLGPAQDQLAQAAKANRMTSKVLVEKVIQARTGDAARARALWKPVGRG